MSESTRCQACYRAHTRCDQRTPGCTGPGSRSVAKPSCALCYQHHRRRDGSVVLHRPGGRTEKCAATPASVDEAAAAGYPPRMRSSAASASSAAPQMYPDLTLGTRRPSARHAAPVLLRCERAKKQHRNRPEGTRLQTQRRIMRIGRMMHRRRRQRRPLLLLVALPLPLLLPLPLPLPVSRRRLRLLSLRVLRIRSPRLAPFPTATPRWGLQCKTRIA